MLLNPYKTSILNNRVRNNSQTFLCFSPSCFLSPSIMCWVGHKQYLLWHDISWKHGVQTHCKYPEPPGQMERERERERERQGEKIKEAEEWVWKCKAVERREKVLKYTPEMKRNTSGNGWGKMYFQTKTSNE